MKSRFITLLFIIFISYVSGRAASLLPDVDIHIPDSILPSASTIDTRAYVGEIPQWLPGYQKTEEERWWWNQAKKLQLDINDTTVRYPKFIEFCLNVYKWGDRFFNSYDPEYVVGTGKRWKARIVNDNWVDSYIMTFPEKMKMQMLSNVYANIGAYIQYMAVSMGYTYDMNDITNRHATDHKKMEFGFNCALFNIELYYHENTGGTYLRRFGDYRNGKYFKENFPGLQLYTFGVDAIYYFNHKRYSHGAAYNFSKFQKKSQGSPVIGLSHTNIKLSFDFTQLPLHLLPYLTIPVRNYFFHYNSYAIVFGYGYNWVIKPKLLFNATLTPSIGVTHCYEDSLEGAKWMPSVNIAGRSSLTYNLGNFFFSGIFRFNGHWYKSGTYSLFSSIENFSANIGFRF